MEAAALALSAFLSVEVVAAAVAAVDGRLGSLRLSHSVGNPTKTDDQTTSHSWSWGHMLMEQPQEICMTKEAEQCHASSVIVLSTVSTASWVSSYLGRKDFSFTVMTGAASALTIFAESSNQTTSLEQLSEYAINVADSTTALYILDYA